jgi:hypothetical protein
MIEAMIHGQQVSYQDMVEAHAALSAGTSLHQPLNLKQQILTSGLDNDVGLSLIQMLQDSNAGGREAADDDDNEDVGVRRAEFITSQQRSLLTVLG